MTGAPSSKLPEYIEPSHSLANPISALKYLQSAKIYLLSLAKLADLAVAQTRKQDCYYR